MEIDVLTSSFLGLRDKLHHIALNYLESDEDAKDALQDTWLKLRNGGKVETEERTEKETTQSVSQPKCATLSMRHGKRKRGTEHQKSSDVATPQEELPIIAETTTTATEPTMPSTHIAPENVVYIINGERQVPTPDMPSVNDLRLRGQRLTAEVMQQIQKPIEF